MRQKKGPALARRSGRRPNNLRDAGGVQVILPESQPIDKLNSQVKHALAQAAERHDWRLWWSIYCEANGLPPRPTGADIKRAQRRRAGKGEL